MERENERKFRMREIQQELIEEVISGGMMGGYIEEGFPFFYINQKMLDYLGYEDEKSFVTDINGMIINCIHPDDREMVDRECEKQIALKGTYNLEYRMKKKDGSYIWVHDYGKKYLDNGKEAIISVCYDITSEKEQNLFLQEFVDSINGSMGIYLVDQIGRLTPIYISTGIGKMLGFTADQYLDICKDDAMDCIYPADKKRMIKSILHTVNTNIPDSISFRALNKKGTYTWLNGSFCNAGEVKGKTSIRVVFTPVTDQFEQQQDVIHNVPGGICLYTWNGQEVIPLVVSDQFAMLHKGKKENKNSQGIELNYDLVHPEDIAGYKGFIQSILNEENEERSHSYRVWSQKDDKYIWLLVTTKVHFQLDATPLIYASYSNIDAMKNAEETIRHNEELLELTCSFAGVWTFIYDLKTKIVYPGKTLQDAFGLKEIENDFPDCMINTPYIPKESVKIYREMVKKVDEGQEDFKTDILVQYNEIEKHWLRYEWKIIEYEQNHPRLAIGYARNIDQEKTLIARIHMEQERLLGGDGILLAYIISNITKNEIKENRAFHGEIPMAESGIPMDEGTKKGTYGIVETKKREQCLFIHQRTYLEKLYNKGISSTSMEYRRKKRDGTIGWEKNILNILREPESGDLFLYEYCYDINKEKLLEEIMQAAVKYDYERIGSINLEEDQISILEPDDQTQDYQLKITCYSALCQKYAKEQVIEEDREMFLSNVLPKQLEKRLQQTSGYDFVHREQGNDGNYRYKQNRHTYYDKKQKICLITRSDITDTVTNEEQKQKKLQEALEKERKAAKTKSDFLSRMSHELRTPLNAITGYTTILKQNAIAKSDNRKQDIEYLHAVQSATHYLLAIIDDLLDRQKIETGTIELIKEKINLNDYMQNIADMIRTEANQKEIAFTYLKPSVLNEYYLLDGVRLQQVILNLLHNAVKFTAKGGKVKLTLEEMVSSHDNDYQLKFMVYDTGIGMSKEFMEQSLYQVFTQENQGMRSPYEGTGIGLSISKELITLMGGSISCESEKGKGTIFTVIIPAMPVKNLTKKRRKKKQKNSYDLGGVNVLVCEDNLMNQEMTKCLLNRMNCKVEVADDGQIAFEKFSQSKNGHYDFIFMDLRMPVMDGFQATKAIRSLDRGDAKKIPIVALSANAFADDIKMSIESGMNEHLSKPVDARILYSKIKEYCK